MMDLVHLLGVKVHVVIEMLELMQMLDSPSHLVDVGLAFYTYCAGWG